MDLNTCCTVIAMEDGASATMRGNCMRGKGGIGCMERGWIVDELVLTEGSDRR